jgi:uncharacterized protein (TIGR03067 family)
VSVLAATVLLAASVSAQEALKKELQQFQGTWAIEYVDHDGHKPSPDKIKSMKLVIAGNRLTVQGEKLMQSTIKLDPSKSPKTIDITYDDGPDKGKVLQGIYELNGDGLKLCLSKPGKERPTQFVSKENSGLVLMVLKRDKS